jgi:hypothetical protein
LIGLCNQLYGKKPTNAQEYYKNSPYIQQIQERMRVSAEFPCNIAILSDYDDVMACPRSAMGTWYKIATIVGMKNLMRVVRVHHKTIFKDGAIYNQDGIRINGAANCMRFLGKSIPAFNIKYDAIMKALSYAKPINATIELYQKLQSMHIPILIVTNNDKETLDLKLHNMNKELLKNQKTIFEPEAVFYAGLHDSTISDDCYCLEGKPSIAYYKKAFAYAQKIVDDTHNNWLYIFIDDQEKNIQAMREYAQSHNLPIIAFQRTTSKRLMKDLEWLFGTQFLAESLVDIAH